MSGERPVPREPFPLLTKTQDLTRPVTLAEVSEQVGALAAHVGAVHREVALNRSETKTLRTDLSTLTTFVMGDQAPRVSAVEKKTSTLTLPPGVKATGKYAMIASVIPFLEWLVPLVKQFVEKSAQ